MSIRTEKDRQKQIQDRCQNLLTQMLRDEDNKYCVDCDAKGPRWASWNLGIFLCIRCAGIHRNLGVHISKVKSVNLDSWTPEQVVSLQQMGNSRARAVYEANLPDSFRRPQTDSALESFIRAKYESKKYIAQEWVPPPLPKVNWDKELDEEAERARKKKREVKNTTPIPVPKKMEVIPQALPKPHSSPKSREGKSARSRGNSGGAGDLLGLDTPTSEAPQSNEDVFTSFLSAVPPPAAPSSAAPQVAPAAPAPASKRSEEEESFFNQSLSGAPSGSTAPGGKLTTDSILALYSKGPPIPTVGAFGGVAVGGGVAVPGGGVAVPSGGVAIPGGVVAPPLQQFPFPAQPSMNVPMFVAPAPAVPGPAAASNPFFSMQQQAQPVRTAIPTQIYPQQQEMAQQFSGLSLGPTLPAQQFQGAGAPVSNQLWQ